MSIETRRVLWRCLLFGLFGMLCEVLLMAQAVGRSGNLSLRGASSPWMLPIYGLIGVLLEPIWQRLARRGVPLPGRALAYTALLYLVEFASGMLFLSLGINRSGVDNMHTVWDYGWTRYHLYGQVSLDMLPTWYLFCLTLEFFYRRVDACATVLAMRTRAEDLLAQHEKATRL